MRSSTLLRIGTSALPLTASVLLHQQTTFAPAYAALLAFDALNEALLPPPATLLAASLLHAAAAPLVDATSARGAETLLALNVAVAATSALLVDTDDEWAADDRCDASAADDARLASAPLAEEELLDFDRRLARRRPRVAARDHPSS